MEVCSSYFFFWGRIISESFNLSIQIHVPCRLFYGPGGPYALFAGKDASRALAKMSFEDKDLTGDITGLGPFELEALQDWEYKFMSKYVKVGTVKKSVPVTDGAPTGEPEGSTNRDDAKPAEDGQSEATGAAVKPAEEGPSETTGTAVKHAEDGPSETTIEPAEDGPFETAGAAVITEETPPEADVAKE